MGGLLPRRPQPTRPHLPTATTKDDATPSRRFQLMPTAGSRNRRRRAENSYAVAISQTDPRPAEVSPLISGRRLPPLCDCTIVFIICLRKQHSVLMKLCRGNRDKSGRHTANGENGEAGTALAAFLCLPHRPPATAPTTAGSYVCLFDSDGMLATFYSKTSTGTAHSAQ